MPQLPGTDLTVSDLCLGGNVFGWTADEPTSFAVLDRFLDATPSTQPPFVDTAESYGNGRVGADPRRLDGRPRGARPRRRGHEGLPDGQGAPAVGGGDPGGGRAVAGEPADRPDRPLLRALRRRDDAARGDPARRSTSWCRRGRCATWRRRTTRRRGCAEALETSDRLGIARYVALQTHYNLMERDRVRGRAAGRRRGERASASLPYYGLAKGFLTGKYRAGEQVDSPRAEGAAAYVGEKGDRVLTRAAAGRRGARGADRRRWRCAGWPTSRPSWRRSPARGRWSSWPTLLPMQDLVLTDEQRQLLTEASA